MFVYSCSNTAHQFRPTKPLPFDRASLQSFQQLRTGSEGLNCPGIVVPLPVSVLFLRPICLFFSHSRLEELIVSFWCMLRDRTGRPQVFDLAEIPVDRAYDSCFLPGFPTCCSRRCGLIQFPTTFWKNPVLAARGLDQQDFRPVG